MNTTPFEIFDEPARKHKARDEAQRNPGFNVQKSEQPARATEVVEFCRPFHGRSHRFLDLTQGFAPLHPGLYSVRLLRRLIVLLNPEILVLTQSR